MVIDAYNGLIDRGAFRNILVRLRYRSDLEDYVITEAAAMAVRAQIAAALQEANRPIGRSRETGLRTIDEIAEDAARAAAGDGRRSTADVIRRALWLPDRGARGGDARSVITKKAGGPPRALGRSMPPPRGGAGSVRPAEEPGE